MSEIKNLNDILADNLVYYRKAKGLTQIQLAEELHYSDKSISKWERGEGLPDVLILKSLAEFYGIDVDDFFKQERKKISSPRKKRKDHIFIKMFSIAIVWIVATITFFSVYVALVWPHSWLIFIYAVLVSAIVLLTLASVYWNRITFFVSLSLLIWSLTVSVHLSLLVLTNIDRNLLGFIYLIGVALQAGAIIWYIYLIYLKNRKQK